MNFNYFSSLILALFLFVPPDVSAQTSIGAVVQGQLSIQTSRDGLKTIPLPPGQWQIAYREKEKGSMNSGGRQNNFIDTVLVQINNGVLSKALYARVNDDSDGYKKYNDEPCKANNHFHKNNYGTQQWNQRCLLVSHNTNWLGADTKSTSTVRSLLINNDVVFPKTVFGMSYWQFNDQGRILRVTLRFNPVAYGFADSSSNFNFSPWHKDLISKNADMFRFANQIVSYSEAYATALQNSFNKRPSSFQLEFDEPSKKFDKISLEESQRKCLAIGFRQGTSAFGECVKELQSR